MTFEKWFSNRTTHGPNQARDFYSEITGDTESSVDLAAVIQLDAGFVFELPDGRYWTICGRDELIAPDLETVARFLWDNHSKNECFHKGY